MSANRMYGIILARKLARTSTNSKPQDYWLVARVRSECTKSAICHQLQSIPNGTGGPERTLLKPPKQVAKVLYGQFSKKDFYIPEFRMEEAKELLSNIEYVL